MREYVIGVDIGTQGTKAALFDLDLKLVETTFEASRLISPKPGVVWQEADDIYGSVVRTISDLIQKSGIASRDIKAVGVDGQMAGIMGIDEDGEASTYYDSWLDVRSSVFVSRMEQLAGETILQTSGGPVTSNHATKILWWKKEYPEQYKKTSKFVLPHGYVVNKMAGNSAEGAVFDYTCLHFNSFSDNLNKGWSREILDLFEVEEDKMPRVVSPFEVIGTVSDECAGISGLTQGTPIVAGAGDSAASTFGSGMFYKDMILDCAGTASILCSVVDTYVPDVKNKTMVMMRSPVDNLWNPLAYIGGGGLCVRWIRDQLTGSPPMTYEELEAEADKISAGSEGILFCPHFSGRVLPSEPNMRGVFYGLDFKHTRAHMYRAVMEGIAYEYRYFLSALKGNYPANSFEYLYSIGGGSNSRLFSQIKADVLGIPVKTFKMGETALVGSAVIAAVGTGLLQNYEEVIIGNVRERNHYNPIQSNADIYESGITAYLRMLNSISSVERNG